MPDRPATTVDPHSPLFAIGANGRYVVQSATEAGRAVCIDAGAVAWGDRAVVSDSWGVWCGFDRALRLLVCTSIESGKRLFSRSFDDATAISLDDRSGVIAVSTESDRVHYIEVHSNEILGERAGLTRQQYLPHAEPLGITAATDGTVSLEAAGRSRWSRDMSAMGRVFGAAATNELLLTSWFDGGITAFSLEDGSSQWRLDPNDVWMAELAWSPSANTVVGFGSLGGRGVELPIQIDLGARTASPMPLSMPDQREFVRGAFFDWGRHAVIESKYLWRIQDGTVRPVIWE